MPSLLKKLATVVIFFILYVLIKSKSDIMSSKSVRDKLADAKADEEAFNTDNLVLHMEGRSIPFNQVNKPHHVVLGAKDVLPKPDPAAFPPVEKEAREREDALQAQREQAKKESNL